MVFDASPFSVLAPSSVAPEGVLASACVAALPARQRTLRGTAQCSGVGIHSGENISLRLLPADIDAGITFVRTDLKNGARSVRALWNNVIDTRLCTVIGNDHGGHVATVEHLMAALHAAGVDNATVEVNGPEVPVMDGSAADFVFLIEMAGVCEQNAPRREIVVLKPVAFSMGDKRVSFTPSDRSRYTVSIDFDTALIGRQRYEMTLSPESFKTQIARARTFGFLRDVEEMTKRGLMRGGSLDNAIVIDEAGSLMNKGGLRYSDEFVRHKTLDIIGDLALAGAPIRGHYEGVLPGHAVNNALLRVLFSDPSSFVIKEGAAVESTLSIQS